MSLSSLVEQRRERMLAEIRTAIGEGRGSIQGVAQRTGLHQRTVRRLLQGETRSDDALERVARALRVEVPEVAEDSTMRHGAAGDRPVSGWKSASRELGVSTDTLRRRRSGRCHRYPWWPSREALFAWFDALCEPL